MKLNKNGRLFESNQKISYFSTRYRRGVIPQKNLRVMQAEAMMIVIWWWILFNMITDWGHIVVSKIL